MSVYINIIIYQAVYSIKMDYRRYIYTYNCKLLTCCAGLVC